MCARGVREREDRVSSKGLLAIGLLRADCGREAGEWAIVGSNPLLSVRRELAREPDRDSMGGGGGRCLLAPGFRKEVTDGIGMIRELDGCDGGR